MKLCVCIHALDTQQTCGREEHLDGVVVGARIILKVI
jgi:hypothetical protein